MQARGVRPSSFTLSVLAKLAGRSRQPHKALELCREIAQKYRIKFNVHVYNNLIQAWTLSRDGQRASAVFRQMLAEDVCPDSRTYALLLRNCVGMRQKDDAVGFLRAAAGLRGAHPKVAAFGAGMLQPSGGISPKVVEEALEGIANQCGDYELAVKLHRELTTSPKIRLDPKFSVKLASHISGHR